MKKDDSNIPDASLRNVRKHADLVLRRADALDRLPTPVYDVVAAAKLEISRENIFDAVYLGGLYRRLPNTVKLAPETLKRALGKVLGVLDREERVIHLDGSLHEKKKKFLSIHEVGHDVLPWQQKTFSFLEDSDQELDPGTHDLYEREANCFASEVMFQLDKFAAIAEDFAFGIRAPLDLSGKFGSSFYAAARRYVTTRRREACVLAVFERPVQIIGKGECMKPRRVIPSPMFCTRFRNLKWPEEFGPESFFVQNRPKNKFTAARPCVIKDADGHSVSCLAEAFDSSHAIFFLIYDPATVGTSVRL